MRVTNGNDNGVGSLRQAIETNADRIIRFDYAGFIDLEDMLEIPYSNLYIDGASAPNPGVHLRAVSQFPTNRQLIGSRRRGPSLANIEIAYLFAHQGDVHNTETGGPSAIRFEAGLNNLYVHHCTLGFTHENVAAITRPTDDPPCDPLINWTWAWNVFHHPFSTHPTGMNITNGSQDDYTEVYNGDVHHNLFVHCSHRVPKVMGGKLIDGVPHGILVANNVSYGWQARVWGVRFASYIDWCGNTAIPSATSGFSLLGFIHDDTYGNPSLYMDDNVLYNKDGTIYGEDFDAFGWCTEVACAPGDYGDVPEALKRGTPLADAPNPVLIQARADAYAAVLAGAGASSLSRYQWDYHDAMIADVVNRTSLTGHVEDSLAAIAALQNWTDEDGWYPLTSSLREPTADRIITPSARDKSVTPSSRDYQVTVPARDKEVTPDG